MTLTPATFPAALIAGGSLTLGPGDYGDLKLNGRAGVSITAADPANPPRFRSALIRESRDVSLDGLTIRFTPDALTVDSTPVVRVSKSQNVTVGRCKISSGMAVAGVVETAPKLESSGNVIGWPTCRGVSIETGIAVTVHDCELFDLARGVVVLIGGSGTTIRDNLIYRMRKTSILGGADDLSIERNHLHSNRPWRWGETPVGDHADYIAVWNGGPAVMRNISIVGNCMETGAGTPIMGGWVQGKAAGIEGLTYADNLIVGGHHVGFSLSDVRGAVISGNRFVQDRPAPKAQIGISISDGTSGVVADDNFVGWIIDKAKGTTGNTVTRTRLVQPTVPTPA